MEYIYPSWNYNEIKTNPKIINWINFFGQEELYTTADRITYILNINESVFADESEFISTVLHTLSKQLAYDKQHIHYSDKPYKQVYQKLIPVNLHVNTPTIHHIIFQNKLM
jgi:hypothetical protein